LRRSSSAGGCCCSAWCRPGASSSRRGSSTSLRSTSSSRRAAYRSPSLSLRPPCFFLWLIVWRTVPFSQLPWFIAPRWVRRQRMHAVASRSKSGSCELPIREETDMSGHVDLRLKYMDANSVDVQVLHDTMFIESVTDRPAVEVALYKAWNRWLADIWKQS